VEVWAMAENFRVNLFSVSSVNIGRSVFVGRTMVVGRPVTAGCPMPVVKSGCRMN